MCQKRDRGSAHSSNYHSLHFHPRERDSTKSRCAGFLFLEVAPFNDHIRSECPKREGWRRSVEGTAKRWRGRNQTQPNKGTMRTGTVGSFLVVAVLAAAVIALGVSATHTEVTSLPGPCVISSLISSVRCTVFSRWVFLPAPPNARSSSSTAQRAAHRR